MIEKFGFYKFCFMWLNWWFQMCKAIDNPTTGNDTFAKLYGAANVYYNYSGTAKCFNLSDDSDPHGLSGWGWQV